MRESRPFFCLLAFFHEEGRELGRTWGVAYAAFLVNYLRSPMSGTTKIKDYRCRYSQVVLLLLLLLLFFN